MVSDKLRRQIVFEAARLMYQRRESEYHQAKKKAARRICQGWVKPSDLPSNREIRNEIQRFVQRALEKTENKVDRFQVYRSLLLPLDRVNQPQKYHPEGDVLYHSLQVFDLACDELPYDEEFLLAALLHDLGKGIDPLDHIAAGLEALGEFVTDRTVWLIEHHIQAQAVHDGSIGVRARRRLQQSENFEELLLLGECDRNGCVSGVEVPDLDEALDYVRDLAKQYG